MKELTEAIKARFDSASGDTLRALVTGIWLGVAPQGTRCPYITYNNPASATDFVKSNATHDIFRVQFSVWDDDSSPARCLAVRDAIISLFDSELLTLTTKNTIYANRVGGYLVPDPDSGWACHVDYEYRTG